MFLRHHYVMFSSIYLYHVRRNAFGNKSYEIDVIYMILLGVWRRIKRKYKSWSIVGIVGEKLRWINWDDSYFIKIFTVVFGMYAQSA